jgi:hypothetical protein
MMAIWRALWRWPGRKRKEGRKTSRGDVSRIGTKRWERDRGEAVGSRNSEPSAGNCPVISFCLATHRLRLYDLLRPHDFISCIFSLHLSLMSRAYNNSTVPSIPNNNAVLANPNHEGVNTGNMDRWRVAVLGDGGVGKTALAVQVCFFAPFYLFYSSSALVHLELLRRYVMLYPCTLSGPL